MFRAIGFALASCCRRAPRDDRVNVTGPRIDHDAGDRARLPRTDLLCVKNVALSWRPPPTIVVPALARTIALDRRLRPLRNRNEIAAAAIGYLFSYRGIYRPGETCTSARSPLTAA